MADKRISQLVDRGTVANNDVVPIVVSGAVTTNKATISSIQTFMQGNLDLGVTSVGITFGTSGTDINASGSPVTSSGNITINLPTASATNRGALSSADWITFNSKQPAGNYVTLDTVQTITAQKTFTTSGSSDTMIISHGSGSGFALDVIKAGNGEAIRVQKTSGSGNAMTISGGNFEAGTIVKTGGTSSQFLKADGSVDSTAYTTNTGTVTSVGLSSATSGVTIGSTPITTSGTITLAIATASGSQNGLLSSTDWTTFNGKQNALTNPVTGTGVSGRVAFWNGTTTQASDNQFFWDNTNKRLGVGTNTPSVNFEVSGDSGLSSGSGNPIALRIRDNSTGSSWNVLDDFGQIQFFSNDASTPGAVNIRYTLGTTMEFAAGQSTCLTFRSSASGILTERWRMTSAGILQSNGAQTIQTSTGNLTLATAAGNGNIVLNAHGDGNVTTNDSIFIGSTSGINYGGLSNKLSVATTNYNLFDISRFSNDNDGARLYLGKSRGSTIGSSVIVQNGDLLGTISFEGDCGEGMVPAASISAEVDGVPGLTSDMPGRLIFKTCPDNTTFATERLRIASTGVSTFSGTGDDIVIIGKATAGQNAYLQLNAGTSANAYINSIGSGKLILGANGAASNHLTILSTGNVGIGTASSNASSGYKMLRINGATTGGEIVLAGNEVEYAYMYANSGNFVIDALASQPMRFRTGAQNRMEITSDGYVRLLTSGGIQFNGDTAAANALDDYEEGTWTPVIRGSGTAGTYELSTPTYSTYNKIGRQVTVATQITLQGSITGGGTGYLQITGLPFTKANNMSFIGAITLTGVDFTGQFVSIKFVTVSPSTVLYLAENVDNGASIDLPISAISAGDGIGFTITYFE